MPLPAMAIPALIAGGTQVLGSAINAFSTARQNRRSMKFSSDMYNRQYGDNVNFWRMQNEYNSPQAQMKRFQEAGLNPHLIYSRGQPGQAAQIKSPDVQMPQFRTPDFSGISNSGASAVNAYYDTQIKQAQVDNLKAQNTAIHAETALKTASTERSLFDLGLAKELRNYSAEAIKENVRKLKADISMTLSENQRRGLMNASNLKEATERILNSKMGRRLSQKQIQNLAEDINLKKLDAELWDQGITRNDPLWMRIIVRQLQDKINLFNKPFLRF